MIFSPLLVDCCRWEACHALHIPSWKRSEAKTWMKGKFCWDIEFWSLPLFVTSHCLVRTGLYRFLVHRTASSFSDLIVTTFLRVKCAICPFCRIFCTALIYLNDVQNPCLWSSLLVVGRASRRKITGSYILMVAVCLRMPSSSGLKV